MKAYRIAIILLFSCFFQFNTYSQVGIGTTDPDASSILEMESTTQGVLTPRMTTAQRNTIASPVEGLLVFDTDEDAFYFYTGSSWSPMASATKRDNFKLIKSAADLADELAAGGGAAYELDTNTLYEINGAIALAVPIDLNDAYISGLDTNEDMLIGGGAAIFSGSKGGSIRGLTLSAPSGAIFDLSGSGAENLIFRDCVVASSANVGSITNFNLAFLSIIQFVGNTSGITYTNIGQLLLNSQGWAGSNGGTYETFIGTFDVITKQGGFSEVIGATAAMDVIGVTSISGGGTLRIVDFYGGGNYINGVSPYVGYNFTNDWNVDCPGIPMETDNNATGDIHFSGTVGSGISTSFTSTGVPSRKKLAGTTASNNLFRFSKDGNNKIVYDGKKTRYFGISSSLSFQGDTNRTIFVFYIAKNGSVVDQTKVYRENGDNNDVGAAAVVGTLELSTGDSIEVWVERYSGSGGLLLVSLNLTVR